MLIGPTIHTDNFYPCSNFVMAIRVLESRLEQLSVTDENEPPVGGSAYHKTKVGQPKFGQNSPETKFA